MMMRWSSIAFLHWPIDVDVLRPLVLDELTIDTFDDQAWIGLVPFRMMVRPPFVLPIPFVSMFPEINVRTYVRDERGRRGLYFLSLDLPRSAAVVVARAGLGLPYMWSRIDIDENNDGIAFTAERRSPSPAATTSIVVPTKRSFPEPKPELAAFLTARFRLFGRGPLGMYSVNADHPPWNLRRVRGTTVDDEFISAAGVQVEGPPMHVHLADDMDVRIGFPKRLNA
jgi:uncharacterized protein YqjF (DUF2071 family)